MGKIMMTEDQAEELIRDCVPFAYSTQARLIFRNMKEHGYITKSIIEEAEEMYIDISTAMRPLTGSQYTSVIEKQHDAIQELKKRLEEATE
jgi:hypothetical protein